VKHTDADHALKKTISSPVGLPPERLAVSFSYLAAPFIVRADSKIGTLRLAFDLEADGLADVATKVHCIVVADLDGDQIDEYGPDRIAAALEHLARADYLVGHNVTGYDLPLVRRLHNWVSGPGCTIVDTLVASRLILPHIDDLDDKAAAMGDPALGKFRGRYSIEAWGLRLCIPKVGTEITDWSVWTPEMQERCAGDAAICKALWRFLQPGGYSQQALELEHRAAAICNQITADGVPFDTAAAELLRRKWAARRSELEAKLLQQFPGTNLNSRQQIGALLEARGWVPEKRTKKAKQPQIDDDLLETIPGLYPEFAGLAEHYILGRRLGQLSDGEKAWCKNIGVDGRIHGGLIHIGTPHSRAKHLDPNLAQVPNPKKGKPFAAECRALFRTNDDWVFVAADQASLQDRGYAHYLHAFDGGAYAKAFLDGADTHWQSAAGLGLVPKDTPRDKQNKTHEAIREGAKRFRYAFLYGCGFAKAGQIISDTVRSVQQIDSTNDLQRQLFGGWARPSEAALTRIGKQAVDGFMAATPGLRLLRERLKAHAQKHGWLPALDGRRVPVQALHSALNFIVTSSEAIICKRWLVNVHDELRTRFRYGWDGDVVIVLWVHDELVCCCRPEIADQVGEILVRHAREPAEFYGFKVPLDAEYKIGGSWAGDAKGDEAQPVTQADIDEINSGEGIEPITGTASPWSSLIEVLSGSAEFEAILASLSEEDRATVRPPRSNGHDQRNAENGRNRDGYPAAGARERDNGHQVAFFIYKHADGQPYLGVKKTSAKQFPQYHWTGSGWALGAPKGPKIPYRLPELVKAPLDAWVAICAGEKDADTAAALGFVATTNPEGERKGAWAPDLNAWFAGRKRVAIMEDHDATGAAHVIEVAEALRGIVPDIHIVTFRDLPEHGDLTDWKERGHGPDDLLTKIETAKPYKPTPRPSPIRQWDGEPVPELEYSVPGRYPVDNAGLFSGEGGQGKSSLVQQLCVAHVLAREWLGCSPRQGPAIYIECEDAESVLHWRLKAIAAHYGTTLTAIADAGFQMFALTDEENAVLATAPNKSGIVRPTPLYDWLYELAGDAKPVMIGIASSSNVFAGNENIRTEVQQFIRLLRRIACVAHGTVLLVTQPSLTGIENKSASHEGLAGTTQWHNGVRARAVMKSVKSEDGADTGLRAITFHKNQYGPASATCFVRYESGLFLPVEGMSIDAAERAAKADEVFITLLKRFTQQQQMVSANRSATYAPSRFAEHPEAGGITKKEFAQAMQRLLDAKIIEIRKWGRPSRERHYLALAGESRNAT
jgi:DNA polymerase I